MRCTLVVLLLLLAVACTAQNNNPAASGITPEISLSVSPSRVKVGESASVRVVMRNPRRDETITLQAFATYTDPAGVEYQVASDPVTLTVDATLRVRIDLSIPNLSVVPGTVTWDGQVVQLISNSLAVDLPGDGNEHVLSLRVIR